MEAELSLIEIESIILSIVREKKDRLDDCGLRCEIDTEEHVPGDPEIEVAFHRGNELYFGIFSILEKEGFGRVELEQWFDEYLEELLEKARQSS